MTDHRIREQVMEEARQAVWAILAVGELLGSHGIDEVTLRRAAPGLLLSPAAVRLAATLCSATLGQIEVVSMVLAGGYNEDAIADIEAEINRRPAPRPRARDRRTRPAAALPATVAPPVEGGPSR